jgi:hypothetical protein
MPGPHDASIKLLDLAFTLPTVHALFDGAFFVTSSLFFFIH